MKIEIKITQDDGEVKTMVIHQQEVSDELLELLATDYAEEQCDCYSNDYEGFLRGAKDVRDFFLNIQTT